MYALLAARRSLVEVSYCKLCDVSVFSVSTRRFCVFRIWYDPGGTLETRRSLSKEWSSFKGPLLPACPVFKVFRVWEAYKL
jgi:hypothetical protein